MTITPRSVRWLRASLGQPLTTQVLYADERAALRRLLDGLEELARSGPSSRLTVAADGECAVHVLRRQGGQEKASDAEVAMACARTAGALKCAREVIREDLQLGSDVSPGAVFRALVKHPLARYYQRVYRDLDACVLDGVTYLTVRGFVPRLEHLPCPWETFVAGEFAPVSLAEQLVATARDLDPSTVHDKRFRAMQRKRRGRRVPAAGRLPSSRQ